ncbi:conjugative transfer TraC domain protein [Orientia tsutsugamushi str. TA763]|nr:conjugative transfer TraC domain protein [Orientia tsutsugamushi str. TA763]
MQVIKLHQKGDQYIICPRLPASNIPGELKSPFHSPIIGNNTLLSTETVFMPLPKLESATPTPDVF